MTVLFVSSALASAYRVQDHTLDGDFCVAGPGLRTVNTDLIARKADRGNAVILLKRSC